MSINMVLNSAYEQRRVIKSICSNLSDDMENLKRYLLDFINEDKLKGDSYKSAKAYLNNVYIPLLNGFILLSDEIVQAQEKFIEQYKAKVDVNSLNSDELEYQIRKVTNIINQLNNMSIYSSTVGFRIESMKYSYNYQKCKIEEKLENLIIFNNSSSDIFREVEDLIRDVQKGILEISNNCKWDSESNTFISSSFNSEWASNLNNKYSKKELDLILEKIPNLTDSDVEKIEDYLNKNPNGDFPEKLKDYLINTLDISSSVLKDTGIGTSTVRFGGRINILGGINGPVGNNSFVMVNENNAQLSNKIITLGNDANKIGSKIGYGILGYNFVSGVITDINQDNRSVGQAISHNTVSTAVQFGGGALGGVAATAIFGSNPVGWAAVGTIGIGIAFTALASNIFEYARSKDMFEINSILDTTGEKIDKIFD